MTLGVEYMRPWVLAALAECLSLCEEEEGASLWSAWLESDAEPHKN